MENKPKPTKNPKPRKNVVPVKQKPVDVVAIINDANRVAQPKVKQTTPVPSGETVSTILPFDKAWDAAIAYDNYLTAMAEKKANADAKFESDWDAAIIENAKRDKEIVWRNRKAADELKIEKARKPIINQNQKKLAHLKGSF